MRPVDMSLKEVRLPLYIESILPLKACFRLF